MKLKYILIGTGSLLVLLIGTAVFLSANVKFSLGDSSVSLLDLIKSSLGSTHKADRQPLPVVEASTGKGMVQVAQELQSAQQQPIAQYNNSVIPVRPSYTKESYNEVYKKAFDMERATVLSTTSQSPQPSLAIQGLPDNYNTYGVMPDGLVVRLTNNAMAALPAQLANMLESQYTIQTLINGAMVAQAFEGSFCYATPNWTCPFACLGNCGQCSGNSYSLNGCGAGTINACNSGSTQTDCTTTGGTTTCGVTNGCYSCTTTGGTTTCKTSVSYPSNCCGSIPYGGELTDQCVPTACSLPAGDGLVLYYDKAGVSITQSPITCPGYAPASLFIYVTLSYDGNTPSWAPIKPWPTCSNPNGNGSPPITVGDINYTANLPVLGTMTGNGYAAANEINIQAYATPAITTGTTSWGPDTTLSFTAGGIGVSSVTMPGFYVTLITWSCSIFGWDPCLDYIDPWMNGLISGMVQGTVQNAVTGLLNNQLAKMLNSAIGLPLDLNAKIGNPFTLMTNCYLIGAYPQPNCTSQLGYSGMYGDCNGIKIALDFGMLPAIYTPYYSSNNSTCDTSCVDTNSFNPVNVLLKNPPTTGVNVAANVFNNDTVPSGTYLYGGSSRPIPWSGYPYDLGIGLSQDVLNELVYDLYTSGLTCININVNTFPSLASMLNVNAFKALVPAITDIADPNTYVAISLIPRSLSGNSPPPVSVQLGHTLSQGGFKFTSPSTISTSMIYADIPNYQIDFYATVGGVQERMFTLNWNLQAGIDLDYLVPTPLVGGKPTTYGVLQLGALLVPQINQVTNIYPGITPYMAHGISQLIPTILSAAIGVNVSMPINLSALGINVGFWYIGPDPEAGDADANGTPDFLSMYAYAYGALNWGAILPSAQYDALMNQGAPHAYIVVPDGSDVGLAPGTLALGTLSVDGKQSKLLGLKPLDSVVNFVGYDPMDYDAPLDYSYRLDGGLWSPFTTSTQADLPYLTEGVHTFEVMARNEGNFSDLTPACLTFRVDSVPPTLSVTNMKSGAVVGSDVELDTKVWDYQTAADQIVVKYSLDSGAFKTVSTSGSGTSRIFLDELPVGQHNVVITATDASGNTSKTTLGFVSKASSSMGCGCAGTRAVGSGDDLGMLLLVMAGMAALMLRRRLAYQRHPAK
ncbi:MAG: hypothetical protein M1517_10260 [Deltaproteobacteria bacterium]|nr:hypothetical protein [Deltaproteobacteria bacterium]